MSDHDTLSTSARLVELFRWMVDPSCDPTGRPDRGKEQFVGLPLQRQRELPYGESKSSAPALSSSHDENMPLIVECPRREFGQEALAK